jgi:hypothetical protein
VKEFFDSFVEPIPVVFIPRKPHPNGLVYLLVTGKDFVQDSEMLEIQIFSNASNLLNWETSSKQHKSVAESLFLSGQDRTILGSLSNVLRAVSTDLLEKSNHFTHIVYLHEQKIE